MNRWWLLPVVFVFFQCGKNEDSTYFEVVVYGNSSAAVTAAVQAAKMGKTVALISPAKHLGGLTSNGLGWTDLGMPHTISGLSREFYQAVYHHYLNDSAWQQETRAAYIAKMGSGESWDKEMVPKDGIMTTFEPHVAETIFNDWVKKHPIVVKMDRWLDRENGIKKGDGKITSIRMLNGEVYEGEVFIDATYEGDLMAATAISFTVGREANAEYQEYANGIQAANATKNQLPIGISPFIANDDTTSGLLPGINPNPGGPDGSGDDKIQAYCYRMCLTDDPSNRVAIAKPANYNEQDFEIVIRAAEMGWNHFFKFDKMPNRKTDSNNSGGISTDFIGMNYSYPTASYEERRIIENAHQYWQLGSIWTLQNNSRIPDSIRQRYMEWGLSKNEFIDHNHWPYQIYVREARRMVSDVVITEHHCLGKVPSKKPIALGSYTMDSHNTQRYVARDESGRHYIKNEGDIQHPVNAPYAIDYGSIVPKRSEARNLLVPVCLSATHIAYGSIRMEPVFMMLGQSAGTAAAIACEDQVAVQDVDYPKLMERLVMDNMLLDVGVD